MQFRRKPQEPLDVNITPLIDVVFLLLIFFMVTTTFQKDAELSINLPQASATETADKTKPIEISINQNGRYYINGKELTNGRAQTIQNALQEASLGQKDRALVIRGDAKANYQNVITVMDVASKLGLVNISLATAQE